MRGLETCQLVCTVQNEDPYRITLRSPLKAFLSRWALGRARRVVVVSGSLAAFVVRHQGVRPDLIDVIPNGVDSTAFTAKGSAVRPGELPLGNPLVGCVGRLSRQKGQRVLISAFHRAYDRLPEASLVLIGGGPDERSLKIAAASGQGRSRVHFLGWRRAVAPYLQHLDLYVQPSLWEGMPFATMEAMAASVPVVGSSAGGLRELLEGGCGTIVPPGCAAPIADAICTLAADPALCERQGRAGRLRVHRNYRADQMASAYIRLFQTLADSTG
jgi:glycosyltransferase involved in cell wall biosynthesis